jgi:hypothetical protein
VAAAAVDAAAAESRSGENHHATGGTAIALAVVKPVPSGQQLLKCGLAYMYVSLK